MTRRDMLATTRRMLNRICDYADKLSVPVEETSAGLVAQWSLTAGMRGNKTTDLTASLAMRSMSEKEDDATAHMRAWTECATMVFISLMRRKWKSPAEYNRDLMCAKVMRLKVFDGKPMDAVAEELHVSDRIAHSRFKRVVDMVAELAEANGLFDE